MLTLVVVGTPVRVSEEVAEAVMDHLWKGLRPGAAISAAKLTEALARRGSTRDTIVAFDELEAESVLDALDAVGISLDARSASWNGATGRRGA